MTLLIYLDDYFIPTSNLVHRLVFSLTTQSSGQAIYNINSNLLCYNPNKKEGYCSSVSSCNCSLIICPRISPLGFCWV